MSLKRCQRIGKTGYKWGDEGKCYVYKAGDKTSRERAKRKAESQGRAIEEDYEPPCECTKDHLCTYCMRRYGSFVSNQGGW